MKTQTRILSLAAMISMLTLQPASALVIGTDLGTANPPATLGDYTMAAYDPGSITGTTRLLVGSGWATWGQGYTGYVYYNPDGSQPLTFTLSGDVQAVYFYMEPNQFADFTMTATDSSGVSVSTVINGYYGSAGVGFHTTGVNEYLTSIVVTADDPTGFAIGNFGLDRGSIQGEVGAVPDAGSSLAMLGLAFAALGAARRHFKA